MADSIHGFDRAPDRYSAGDREVIDVIRDELGDAGFHAFCAGSAIKYELRAGAKGDVEGDAAKARWYRMMEAHVDGRGPDPRCNRPGFVAYRRPGPVEAPKEPFPPCGDPRCLADAAWVDEGERGWCDAHAADAPTRVRPASGPDDFDAQWLTSMDWSADLEVSDGE